MRQRERPARIEPCAAPPAEEGTEAMADLPRAARPLSPHIQIYRPQMTSVTSILTRITGNGLIVAALLGVWWLLAAATGPEAFATADAVIRSWFGKLVTLWALWYHYLAGLRHLYFDSGRGFEIETAHKLGIGVIAGSVVLTILTLLIV
jgi:succinate dehydrogenase / fumarate reductase cytochrome b subunit